MPMKLHTVYIKALQRIKTWEALDIFCSSICILASRLSFCFCFITKAYPPPCWFLNSVPLPCPGEEIQPESDDPVHACRSLQQPESKHHQFAMAGGPSGRREAKKVLKTSQAVLINEGLVRSSSSTSLSGGRRLGSSISASEPSYSIIMKHSEKAIRTMTNAK